MCPRGLCQCLVSRANNNKLRWCAAEDDTLTLADGAGIVEAVGDDVTEFKVGDRVVPVFPQGHHYVSKEFARMLEYPDQRGEQMIKLTEPGGGYGSPQPEARSGRWH